MRAREGGPQIDRHRQTARQPKRQTEGQTEEEDEIHRQIDDRTHIGHGKTFSGAGFWWNWVVGERGGGAQPAICNNSCVSKECSN